MVLSIRPPSAGYANREIVCPFSNFTRSLARSFDTVRNDIHSLFPFRIGVPLSLSLSFAFSLPPRSFAPSRNRAIEIFIIERALSPDVVINIKLRRPSN